MSHNNVDDAALPASWQKRKDQLEELKQHSDPDVDQGHVGGGGNPPGGDGLEARVQNLEKAIPDIRERLARIESKLDGVERHGATHADIEGVGAKIEAMGRTMIQWSIGTAVVLAGIAFTAARFIPGG